MHVNYWDVHHPYLGVEEFVDEVRDSGPPPAWPDEDAIADQQGMTGVRTADLWPSASQYRSDREEFYDWPVPEAVTDRGDVEQFVDGYDVSIRRVDAEVAKLLAALERNGVREETASNSSTTWSPTPTRRRTSSRLAGRRPPRCEGSCTDGSPNTSAMGGPTNRPSRAAVTRSLRLQRRGRTCTSIDHRSAPLTY